MTIEPNGDGLTAIDGGCERRLEHVTVSTCISTATGQ